MNNLPKLRAAIIALLGVFISFGLSSCGETITNTDPVVDPPADTDTSITYFPNYRNVTWVYEIYDSLTSAAEDTVTITIRGELSLQGAQLARVWERVYRVADTTDSIFVRIASDSVQFYESNSFLLDWDLFLFPLIEDKRWANPGWLDIDSSGVQAIDSVSVPAGEFPIAARVLSDWLSNFQTSGNLTTSWIVDSIGIVQRHELGRVIFNMDTTINANKVWRLLESNLIVPPPE